MHWNAHVCQTDCCCFDCCCLLLLPGVWMLLEPNLPGNLSQTFLQARPDVACCLVTGNLEPIGWGKMAALGVQDLFTAPCFGGFGSDYCRWVHVMMHAFAIDILYSRPGWTLPGAKMAPPPHQLPSPHTNIRNTHNIHKNETAATPMRCGWTVPSLCPSPRAAAPRRCQVRRSGPPAFAHERPRLAACAAARSRNWLEIQLRCLLCVNQICSCKCGNNVPM